MNKIRFRLVYNRKKKLNNRGEALIQVEIYQNRRKIYLSSGIYVNPRQWDNYHSKIIRHPQAEELNRMLEELLLELQWEELKYWKRGIAISLNECPHVPKLAKFKPPRCPIGVYWNTLCLMRDVWTIKTYMI